MVAINRFRRAAKEWGAAALAVAAVTVAAVLFWGDSDRKTYRLRVTAGSPDGLRHQIALRLARASKRRGVQLDLVGTAGSEEALRRVDSGEIDLALVQGGLHPRGRDRVTQVAAMRIEPLHLLFKRELAEKKDNPLGLEFLRGRTVNLSEPGSGTYDLARDVLSFAGLHPAGVRDDGDYRATTLDYRSLLAEGDRSRLPDAVFTVSALPSPVVKHLVSKQNYVIMPLQFGEAFTLDTLQPGPSRGEDGGDSQPTEPSGKVPRLSPGPSGPGLVERVHVYSTAIPAYTYGIAPPTPPQAVPTFGTRLLMVAHRDVDTAAIARLLEACFANTPGGPSLDPALLELPPEFEWHSGTQLYRERMKPASLGDEIDFLEKTTSLAGALAGAAFFLWRWNRLRVRRRQESGFESYMLKINDVERRAMALELSAELNLRKLLELQIELVRLKAEALRRFAEGELAGEELVSGFMTHVNDARNYLTRLILHARDNIEEEAVRQRRSADALWFEAVGDLAAKSGSPGSSGSRPVPPRNVEPAVPSEDGQPVPGGVGG
ncbi:MAG: hypothetical protein U0835_23530 [Isosphaeraceae bacterium]